MVLDMVFNGVENSLMLALQEQVKTSLKIISINLTSKNISGQNSLSLSFNLSELNFDYQDN